MASSEPQLHTPGAFFRFFPKIVSRLLSRIEFHKCENWELDSILKYNPLPCIFHLYRMQCGNNKCWYVRRHSHVTNRFLDSICHQRHSATRETVDLLWGEIVAYVGHILESLLPDLLHFFARFHSVWLDYNVDWYILWNWYYLLWFIAIDYCSRIDLFRSLLHLDVHAAQGHWISLLRAQTTLPNLCWDILRSAPAAAGSDSMSIASFRKRILNVSWVLYLSGIPSVYVTRVDTVNRYTGTHFNPSMVKRRAFCIVVVTGVIGIVNPAGINYFSMEKNLISFSFRLKICIIKKMRQNKRRKRYKNNLIAFCVFLWVIDGWAGGMLLPLGRLVLARIRRENICNSNNFHYPIRNLWSSPASAGNKRQGAIICSTCTGTKVR